MTLTRDSAEHLSDTPVDATRKARNVQLRKCSGHKIHWHLETRKNVRPAKVNK